MRLNPFSLTAEPVSSASGDCARKSVRRTSGIPKFYTIEQIAEAVGVSTRTVRRWIDSRALPAHRKGGIVRISEADLAEFKCRTATRPDVTQTASLARG
jgi:excisionase family DNA binding protein